jgi:ATP-dependent protease Clp ATPase subunit
LSKENLKDILLNSDESKLRAVIESLASYDMTIDNLDVIVDGLIEEAISAQIGARGLTTSVINVFLDVLEEIGNNPNQYEKVVLGENILKDSKDYTLIKRKVKKRVKTAEN